MNWRDAVVKKGLVNAAKNTPCFMPSVRTAAKYQRVVFVAAGEKVVFPSTDLQ